VRNAEFLTPAYFAVLRARRRPRVQLDPHAVDRHAADLPGSSRLASWWRRRSSDQGGITRTRSARSHRMTDPDPNPELRSDLVRLVDAAEELRSAYIW
jgi:hypothetical protein